MLTANRLSKASGRPPMGALAVRDDEAGVDGGAVAQHGDAVAVLGKAGVSPDLGVGLVTRGGSGGCHDEFGVGVDDDLHVRHRRFASA
jgi:hypothetical protein